MLYLSLFLIFNACVGYVVSLKSSHIFPLLQSIFFAYSLFYTLALLSVYFVPAMPLVLLDDKIIILYAIFYSSISLFTFVISVNIFESNNFSKDNNYFRLRNSRLFWLLYLLILLILIIFAKNYGWHAVSRDNVVGLETVLYAYTKYLFVCMGCFALFAKYSNVLKNNSKSESFIKSSTFILVLSTQTLLLVFDGGRTTFFGVLIVATYCWLFLGGRFNIIAIFYLSLSVFLLVATRAMAMDMAFIDAVYGSIVVEGVMASYTFLQSLSIVNDSGVYLIGKSYFLDPVTYLILPQGIRESFLFFNDFSLKVNENEVFAPMGGFYYLAEAYANFGVIGVFVVPLTYALIFSKLNAYFFTRPFFFMAVIAAFASISVKVIFSNGLKVFVVYSLCFMFLSLFFGCRLKINHG